MLRSIVVPMAGMPLCALPAATQSGTYGTGHPCVGPIQTARATRVAP